MSAETMLAEAIDELDEKVENEIERSISADTYLQEEIDSIQISAITPSSEDILASYALYINGEQRPVIIDVPKDDVQGFKEIKLGWSGATIDPETGNFTYWPETGDTEVLYIVYKTTNEQDKYQLTIVPLENLLIEDEFSSGLTVDNHIVKVLINPESDSYLTVTPSGVTLTGVAKIFDNIAKDVIGADGNPYGGYNIDFYDAVWSPVEESEVEGHPHTLVKIPDDYAQIPSPSGWTGEEYIEVFYTQTSVHEWYRNVTTNNYIDTASTIVDAIKDLDAALKTESDIRKENEQILQDEIDTETERAQSAETMLQQEIDNLDDKIEAETERAQSAETMLAEAIEEVDEKIDAETQRAISAETMLQEEIDNISADIEAERQRAMSAETMLQEEIDSVSGEVTTLSGAVQDFSAATVDEIARLDGKDIADTGADHSLSVTQGISLERENGEKVEIDIDTNFGLLPNYE